MASKIIQRGFIPLVFYILSTFPGYIKFGFAIRFNITILAMLTPNLLDIPHKVSPLFTTYSLCDIS